MLADGEGAQRGQVAQLQHRRRVHAGHAVVLHHDLLQQPQGDEGYCVEGTSGHGEEADALHQGVEDGGIRIVGRDGDVAGNGVVVVDPLASG